MFAKFHRRRVKLTACLTTWYCCLRRNYCWEKFKTSFCSVYNAKVGSVDALHVHTRS